MRAGGPTLHLLLSAGRALLSGQKVVMGGSCERQSSHTYIPLSGVQKWLTLKGTRSQVSVHLVLGHWWRAFPERGFQPFPHCLPAEQLAAIWAPLLMGFPKTDRKLLTALTFWLPSSSFLRCGPPSLMFLVFWKKDTLKGSASSWHDLGPGWVNLHIFGVTM